MTNTPIKIAVVFAGLALVLIFVPWSEIDGCEIFGFRLHTRDYGVLGTYVGGISAPLFSLAAFILLFMTYQSQNAELKATRALVKKQQFESTFFSLINSLNSSTRTASLWRENEQIDLKGYRIFQSFESELRETMDFPRSNADSMEEYENAYDTVYYRYSTQFDFFLTGLDTIAHFIEREDLGEDSQFYYSLVATQLTHTERVLIQYHIKLRNFKDDQKFISRLKKILWRTGTISLSDHHDFILDPDIHRTSPNDDDVFE